MVGNLLGGAGHVGIGIEHTVGEYVAGRRYFATQFGVSDDEIGWDPTVPKIWVGSESNLN